MGNTNTYGKQKTLKRKKRIQNISQKYMSRLEVGDFFEDFGKVTMMRVFCGR